MYCSSSRVRIRVSGTSRYTMTNATMLRAAKIHKDPVVPMLCNKTWVILLVCVRCMSDEGELTRKDKSKDSGAEEVDGDGYGHAGFSGDCEEKL